MFYLLFILLFMFFRFIYVFVDHVYFELLLLLIA